MILGYASTGAFAFSLKAGPVQFDSSKPLQPVKINPVRVGPVIITPPAPNPIPSTPNVHIDGNGAVATVVNKGDAIAHAPEVAAQNGLNETGKGLGQLVHNAGEAIAKPFRDLGDWFRNLFNQAKDEAQQFAKDALLWLALGLFGTIFGAVLISSTMTALILRRSIRPSNA
jgi:CRISPR/Cas system type I-B associated protein Csh2 (Cas7 group RAMP superfamily)